MNQIEQPDDLDLLMEDVLREVANPAPPAELAARLRTQLRSQSPAQAPAPLRPQLLQRKSFTRPRLVSAIQSPPKSNLLQFTPISTGGMSGRSVSIAMLTNIAAMLICIIVGASVKRQIEHRKADIALIVPLKEKPIEPIRPKVIPPRLKIEPPKIEPPKIEPPKILRPEVKLPDPPKPVPVAAPKPVPVVVPLPPKIQTAAAAPKVQAITMAAKSASVANNDPHPAAVALGHPDSPVPFQKSGPAVASVNMNRGMAGMPAANAGAGPAAQKVTLGNGSPGGAVGGTAPAAVAGVKLGCAGCTGKPGGNGTAPQAAQVALGAPPPPLPPSAQVAKSAVRTAPQVIYKPKAAYTAEATAQHIEGVITVKIKVAANGAVTVLGLVNSLGHGLDESAIACAKGIKFKPAVDASGNPVDWEGTVQITFQLG